MTITALTCWKGFDRRERVAISTVALSKCALTLFGILSVSSALNTTEPKNDAVVAFSLTGIITLVDLALCHTLLKRPRLSKRIDAQGNETLVATFHGKTVTIHPHNLASTLLIQPGYSALTAQMAPTGIPSLASITCHHRTHEGALVVISHYLSGSTLASARHRTYVGELR